MLLNPVGKTICISTSLVGFGIFLAICFYIGITNSSSSNQHDVHDDNISKMDAVTTEKASEIDNVNRSSTLNLTLNLTRKSSAIQRYRDLHEFRKTNPNNDKIPRPSNVQKINNNIDDDSDDVKKKLRTTTDNMIPSATSTEKLSAISLLGCTASCGSCTEVTPKSGVLLSPNYPEHYYSPTDIGYRYCQYSINVPVGQRIHLVFEELNLAFTKWSDFLEVVDKSPDNYGKVLATFNAGDVAVPTTTSGESMLVYFEGNRGGYTKNGRPPAWKASYYVVDK